MFFAPAGEKQARLRSNKTKYQSFHAAVGTLQHSKEHLAPTWTPNGDFCWIIHSEVSSTETVAYLQHRFASPPHLYALYMNQWAFCSMVWHERKIHIHIHMHMRAHTQTHKLKYDPGDPFSVFFWLFMRQTQRMQRILVADFVARNIFPAKQTEQQWAFHARILQRKRSAANCEGGLFTYLPHSRLFDLFETVRFMMLRRHVTVSPL